MIFMSKIFDELTTAELYEILKSRAEIFLIEQNIHYLDMDDIDYTALHCFIMDNNRVTAYLRAYFEEDENTVKVGRVLTLIHGKGLGEKLMISSLAAIKEKLKCKKVSMDAQKHAVGFYEKFGFTVTSEDFLEEGIVHRKMELDMSGI